METKVVDSLVVGYVAELHEYTEVTDHFGIITPRTEGFLIDGIKFVNYNNVSNPENSAEHNFYALSTCSHC